MSLVEQVWGGSIYLNSKAKLDQFTNRWSNIVNNIALALTEIAIQA